DTWRDNVSFLSSLDLASYVDPASVADRFNRAILSAVDFGSHVDMNPVITPVLDLTGFQTEAAKISEYIDTMPSIAPNLSYSKARDIAYGVNGQTGQTPE